MASKRARRATRRRGSQLTSAHADALLSQALQAGALAFLPLRDMASALNTCRALRCDAELPLLGLAQTEIGAHLLRHCCRDWTATRPSFLTAAELLDDATCDAHSAGRADGDDGDGGGDMQRFLRAFDASLDARRGQATALLSVLAMVEARIVPLCYGADELNSYGDLCTARPVVLPLPLGLARQPLEYKFTLRDVAQALNKGFDGIGDVFVATPSAYTHVSDFGAHWEATTTTTTTTTTSTRTSTRSRSTTTKASCSFCEAAAQAIKAYRKDARAALRRFNDVLRARKDEWRAAGLDQDEIHQRRSELKAECFPEDSYPDVNFAEALDDAILADICESGKFGMDPFEGQAAGFDRFDDDVFHALRDEMVELCGSLVQPLKRVLSDECRVVVGRRVCRSWMGDGDGTVKGELVAGITRAGMLVGVYVVTRRVE
jgi:hypothetical protein